MIPSGIEEQGVMMITDTTPASTNQIKYIADLATKIENWDTLIKNPGAVETIFDILGNVGNPNPKFVSLNEAHIALDEFYTVTLQLKAKSAPTPHVTKKSQVVGLDALLTTIKPGRYALPRKADGVIDCFEVVKWKNGKRFLYQLLGGNISGSKFHRKYLSQELQGAAGRAIAAYQKAAAWLYAETYCECPRCHVALTHPRSKKAHIGQTCAKEWGWPW
jgi:hypothetical protein